MRQPEPMARLARRDAPPPASSRRARRRARPGSSHSRSVTPTASGRARSSATALSTPPLIATAVRPALRLGAEDRAERVRERVDRERLAADRGRLEQRQAGERPLEPGRVRLDDPVAVDEQANRSPLAVARRVSEGLDHRRTVAAKRGARRPPRKSTLPMCPSYVNLANQVGAMPFLGEKPRSGRRLPFM